MSAPPANPIAVWEIDLETFPRLVAGWEDLLVERERPWIDHPRNPERARARAALRLLLSRETGTPPDRLRFEHGAHGKPSLDDASRNGANALHYNLSHSRGRALIAIAHGREIGVDVEAVRAVPNWPAIARRAFHAEEIARLDALDPGEAPGAFLRLYAGKEAAAKALGVGMGRAFRRFALPDAREGVPAAFSVPSDLDGRGQWSWHPIEAFEGHAAALCAEGIGWRMELRRFSG